MNKPKGMPDTKRKYRIMLRGACVGQYLRRKQSLIGGGKT